LTATTTGSSSADVAWTPAVAACVDGALMNAFQYHNWEIAVAVLSWQ
jgi:hypothetical protein